MKSGKEIWRKVVHTPWFHYYYTGGSSPIRPASQPVLLRMYVVRRADLLMLTNHPTKLFLFLGYGLTAARDEEGEEVQQRHYSHYLRRRPAEGSIFTVWTDWRKARVVSSPGVLWEPAWFSRQGFLRVYSAF